MLGQYDDSDRMDNYLKLWKNLFNTAVVPLYWEGTEPTQGELRYDASAPDNIYRRPPVDTVCDYCEKNGIAMKGHPLFWHEFIPEWLPDNWDELYPLVEKRFHEISERYADRIPVFDALNEPARIWDMGYERKNGGRKMITPPVDYIYQIFALAEKYFGNNTLILNEAVGAALCEFNGIYTGNYLLMEKLLREGLKIDRIGLQCHTNEDPYFENVFTADRFYGILDTYAKLGKPLVLSEIGLSIEEEELHAEATVQLYKICFSHPAMSGVFWWNLDDDSILTDKKRNAVGENLPHAGLIHRGVPKKAYEALDRLINYEWKTVGTNKAADGICNFRGFYGIYNITVKCGNTEKTVVVDFKKSGGTEINIEL